MVKLNKIYTRTGDGGSAGLVDGSRVSKASQRMAAIGDVDEANAAIGLALAALEDGETAKRLLTVQNDLFDLGADVATPGEIEGALRIVAPQVERLEREIDAMNEALEPLTSFILPSGSQAVAALHLARAIVRRAERSVVALPPGPVALEEEGPRGPSSLVTPRMPSRRDNPMNRGLRIRRQGGRE